MMANLGVSAIHAAIETSVQNNSCADAGPNGYIDKALLVFSRAPRCLGESCRIGIVLHRHLHTENAGKVGYWILAAPCWEEIDIAELPGEGIDRTGASNPNASQFNTGRCRLSTQHMFNAHQCLGIATLRICRTFSSAQHMAIIIDQSHCDFCAAYVNCANHAYFSPAKLLPFHDGRFVRLQIHLPSGAFNWKRF